MRISGPEGRQSIATPARAWIVIARAREPRSGERLSNESFVTPWLGLSEYSYPRLTPWATICRPSGPEIRYIICDGLQQSKSQNGSRIDSFCDRKRIDHACRLVIKPRRPASNGTVRGFVASPCRPVQTRRSLPRAHLRGWYRSVKTKPCHQRMMAA